MAVQDETLTEYGTGGQQFDGDHNDNEYAACNNQYIQQIFEPFVVWFHGNKFRGSE